MNFVTNYSPNRLWLPKFRANSATSINEKILSEKNVYVWPDAKGNVRGEAIAPLYRAVPEAVELPRCIPDRTDERNWAQFFIPMMSSNLNRLKVIAEGLGELCRDVVFVGGSVVELYADAPGSDRYSTDSCTLRCRSLCRLRTQVYNIMKYGTMVW